MDFRSRSIYSTSLTSAEVLGMRLNQLLEQEGQPCSYCIAVYLLEAEGEAFTPEDAAAYRRHLLRDHDMEPFGIQP